MSRQWVFFLALAAFLGIGLIWLLDHPVPSDALVEGGLVVPELSAQINQIQALDILAPGGAVAVSLRRVGQAAVDGQNDDQPASLRWQVVQRQGYEADFAKVFALLRDLAEMEQSEARTANPQWYARLGVEDIGTPEATGRQLQFPLNEIPSLIVGQVDPTGQGSYVRVQGQDQSWLADRVVELSLDPIQWLEPGIMDIDSSDISQVIVRHADGETIQLQNAGTEQNDFVLLAVPEGREAGPAFRRTALANGLRNVSLEDVRAFDGETPDSAVRVLFSTKDGLDFVASVFEQAQTEPTETEPAEPSWWAHFSVSAETDEDNERLIDAVAVDARLSPWLFKISQRKFDDLNVRLEDLLEPLAEDAE